MATQPGSPSPFMHEDALVKKLLVIIRFAVRVLAVLMVFVILMGVADVVWVLYQRILEKPVGLLQISDILATFGAFMAVLIAIEIFVNITVYLQEDVIHIHIVMATALMAIARKIIVLDLKELTPPYLLGLAAVTVATGVTYWLVVGRPRPGGGPNAEQHNQTPGPPGEAMTSSQVVDGSGR